VSTRKTRILDVVHNATNNELVRTKTLVKGAIVSIDATPFRQWYETHYGVQIGHKKGKKVAAKTDEAEEPKSKSSKLRIAARQKDRVLDPALDDQFASGRILACISSRPGQVGRADGYILEGKELEFYQKLVTKKKGKH
jgi:small subunit ribosomal protein S8e